MWNHDRSLTLSILSVRLFFLVWGIFIVGGYWITEFYLDFVHHPELFINMLVTLYAWLAIAVFVLYYLHRLLLNISQEQVFIQENVQALRIISWLCMAIAMIGCISACYYLQFLLVGAAFAFIALIVRVIKNVMAEAILIKEENEFTI